MSGHGDAATYVHEEVPLGTLLTSRHLLHLTGETHAQHLLRFFARGRTLWHVDHGVYFRPFPGWWTEPDAAAIARFRAEAKGELVQIHGADAARHLGLDADAEGSPRLYTTGRTRTMRVSGVPVRLIHVPAVVALHPWEPIGLALAALQHLGPQAAGSVRERLDPETRTALRELLPRLPQRTVRAWLAVDPGARVPLPTPLVPHPGRRRRPRSWRRLHKARPR